MLLIAHYYATRSAAQSVKALVRPGVLQKPREGWGTLPCGCVRLPDLKLGDFSSPHLLGPDSSSLVCF